MYEGGNMSSINPVNMVVDRSGIINTTVVAHVQAQSVNKVAQSANFADEMAQAIIEEDALDKVSLESGQISELSSSEVAHKIRDEEENNENQFQEFSEDEEDNEEIQEENVLHHDPLVGNLLNLKV